MSAAVAAIGFFALPRGLRPALNVRGASQAYTHQIAGYIHIPADGPYRLAIASVGRSRLAVDDRLVASVNDKGQPERAAEEVPAGVHRITIHYTAAPPRAYSRPELRWSHGGGAFVRVPSASLAPRRLRPIEWHGRVWLSLAAVALSFCWIALAIWVAARWFGTWIARFAIGERVADPVFMLLLALTLLLHAYPLWWGLPIVWAQDELEPVDVLIGLRERFAGGWHMKYPPLQLYLMSVAYVPVFGFIGAGVLESGEPAVYTTLIVINRALTVAMSVGTTALAYVCGRMLAGPRAGALGALVWCLVLPLTYYAKLANLDVPYTFWFALSLVGYIRAVTHGAVRDLVLFGGSAAAAVVTKDQAYGLYLLPALHIAWTRLRAAGDGLSAAARTLGDRALLAGTAAGIIVFAAAHNVVFNWSGFHEHVKLITGGASSDYRMVDSLSLGGQGWLLARTLEQVGWSMSIPGALIAIAGIAAAIRGRTGESRRLLTLFVPAISYYVTFIAVVGYVYDRFLLPICLVLAIFAGSWLDRVWPPGARQWKTAAVLVLFVFMSWRTSSIDLLMGADRRYAADDWLRTNLPAGSLVAVLEWRQMLPVLSGFRVVTLPGPPDATSDSRPDTLVVSGGYTKRFAAGGPEAEWYDAALRGERGYRVALRLEKQPALAIVARERAFQEMDTQFTILPKVSPEIVVLVRYPYADEGAGNAR